MMQQSIQRGAATLLFLFAAAAPLQMAHADVPQRVGRVSYVDGDVSVRPAGVHTWTQAAINRVISNGDRVWTGAQARAEIHMGSLTVRLAPSSALDVLELTGHGAHLALMQGRAQISLGQASETGAPDDSAYEVDMPTAAVTLVQDGTYTLEAPADGSSSAVTVRRGGAQMYALGAPLQVGPETTARAADQQAPQAQPSGPTDAFDVWCTSRQRRDEDSPSLHYLTQEVVGYEDLDAYGTWRDSKDYGPLWSPDDAPDSWAPYQQGQWSYDPSAGWTWNDAAPWGFAPSHYGRWVYDDDSWSWAPGPREELMEPVYSPALVAFVELDAALLNYSAGVLAGEALAAWVPLAPGEPYVGTYGGGYVPNNAQPQPLATAPRQPGGPIGPALRPVPLASGLANALHPGGIVVAPKGVLRNSLPIPVQRGPVPAAALSHARVVGANVIAVPTQTSVLAGPPGAPRRIAQPPAAAVNRVLVNHAPAPASATWFVPPPQPVLGRRTRAVPGSGSATTTTPTRPNQPTSETVYLHGEKAPREELPQGNPRPHPDPGWRSNIPPHVQRQEPVAPQPEQRGEQQPREAPQQPREERPRQEQPRGRTQPIRETPRQVGPREPAPRPAPPAPRPAPPPPRKP